MQPPINDAINDDYPESKYEPVLLTKEEISAPTIVFKHFVSIRSLPAQKALLWELLSAVLAGQGPGFTTGMKRENGCFCGANWND